MILEEHPIRHAGPGKRSGLRRTQTGLHQADQDGRRCDAGRAAPVAAAPSLGRRQPSDQGPGPSPWPGSNRRTCSRPSTAKPWACGKVAEFGRQSIHGRDGRHAAESGEYALQRSPDASLDIGSGAGIALGRVRGARSRQSRSRERRSMARGQVQSRQDACSQYARRRRVAFAIDRQGALSLAP